MLTSPFLKYALLKSRLSAFFSNYFFHQLLDLFFFRMRYGFWMTIVICLIFFLKLLFSRFSSGSFTGFFISTLARLFLFTFSFLRCFLFSLPPLFPLGLSSGRRLFLIRTLTLLRFS